MKKSKIISSIITALTLTTSLTTPTARAVDPREDQQKDYVTYHYRAPGGLFSSIYEHFDEKGERLGEHWYDMDGISATYQGIIGDRFFNPTEFLMSAFDRATTTSVLTRMTLPFQPRDLKDYVNYHYRAPGGLFSSIYAHFDERGERLGEHWYDMDAISAIYQETIGDRFFNPTEFLMAAFDRATTTSVLTRMTLPFQPRDLKDYVNYHYRAPGGLFSSIYQHFEEKGERLGEHWYDMDGISATYQGIIGDRFFNPTEFLMAAFDQSTTTSVLNRMTLPFQPYQQEAAQEEAEIERIRQAADALNQRHMARQIQDQVREDQVRIEEFDRRLQEQAREDQVRQQAFEHLLQQQAHENRLEAERLERERLELLRTLSNSTKDYAHYHYRAPGGLFSAIYQHFEEKGERLGEHWYDMDGISNTYQGIIGDRFFSPTEFLMAAFDQSTTTSVLTRMTLPFQPRDLKDYVNHHYRAPGGLFSAIYQHFEERGERLGEHWYDMDAISAIYQESIGDRFFSPTEFLMAAFDQSTTTSVLNRMTLPFQPYQQEAAQEEAEIERIRQAAEALNQRHMARQIQDQVREDQVRIEEFDRRLQEQRLEDQRRIQEFDRLLREQRNAE